MTITKKICDFCGKEPNELHWRFRLIQTDTRTDDSVEKDICVHCIEALERLMAEKKFIPEYMQRVR